MQRESFKQKVFITIGKFIPDYIITNLKFYKHFKRFPNLKNPKSYVEKIQWLKLYDHNPLYTSLVDKYLVKDYITKVVGKEYTVPTIGIWDKAEDIEFENLPDKFVLKCTHDSGRVIICTDKSQIDKEWVIKEMKYSLKRDFYAITQEWPYKNVKRKIIAEKYLVDESGTELKDYKFFTFGGKVEFIQVDFGRFTNHRRNYYDINWNLLDIQNNYPNDFSANINKPHLLKDMICIAEKISESFRHLRVDFYCTESNIYIGELTFFHESGLRGFKPDNINNILGSKIKL